MIGVFDSGVGGLTVLREFLTLLPQYDYLYLGDNARAPYGDKEQAEIYSYCRQAVDYLFKEGCQLVILACNTASAESLRRLQHELPDRKILGVVIPLAESAVDSGARRVGVMATTSTVTSNSFRREIQKLNPKIQVIQVAAPLLVPLIEANKERQADSNRVIKKYVLKLKSYNVDTVILGCTHYAFVSDRIGRYFGCKINLLNSGTIVATKLLDYLVRHPEIEASLSQKGQRRYCTTGETAVFDRAAIKFLGQKVASKKINLF